MTNETDALGQGSVGKLLVKLAMPCILAQLINALYNMVDRMYIGHIEGIGKSALTGVGLCFPLITLIAAFAALVSMGGAPRASIFLGKGDKETASKILGNCVTMLLITSAVLTAVILIFAKDLLYLFGASENTIPYALRYMRIYAVGTVFVQLTLGLNAFISAQGYAKVSMYTILIGAVTNIVLDPIFIFVFKMDVAGAALATILSQSLSCIWTVFFLCGKKSTLRIQRRHLGLCAKIILPCMALGLSPFIMQSTESILNICFNSSLAKYGGDMAVGAMTILASVMQFAMLPLSGLTQGAQPIVSYNYGAKKPERVKKAFKLLLICAVGYATVYWAAVQLFPQMFIGLFSSDKELVAYTVPCLRLYMAVTCIFGVQLACQQTFIALGNAKSSLFLALLRKVILLIPLIYLLPAIFPGDKVTSVLLAEPVADILAVATTSILFGVQFSRSMKKLQQPA